MGRPYVMCRRCHYRTPTGFVLCDHCGERLPKTAQPPALPFLVVDEAGSHLGDTWGYHLRTKEARLGRASDNDVVLDDGRVAPHHSLLRMEIDGRWLVEDLGSPEGTFLNDVRLTEPAPLRADDLLRLGHSAIRLVDEPAQALRPAPASTGAPAPSGSASDSGPSPRSASAPPPLSRKDAALRPLPISGWTMEHVFDEDGREYYVLRNEASGAYLRLTERDAFLWRHMDGLHSVRDLLVAFLAEYHALAAERLFDLLNELAANGFLSNVSPESSTARTGRLARVRSAFARAAKRLQVEFAIKDADGFMTAVYRRIGWPLFTRAGQAALALLTASGLAAFVVVVARGGQSLFEIEGSAAVGVAVLTVATWVTIFVHEMGHALTTKAYGRRVRRAGIMLYFGFVVFFVDTSDIWMEPRGPRIRVSLAGPYSGLVIAGGASLIVLAAPGSLAAAILFKLAAWSYISVGFNLNPLLELDGYFALVDWMEMPLLRGRALAFLKGPLWTKVRTWGPLTRHEWWLASFGALSAVWSALAAVAGILLWRAQIVALAQGGAAGKVVLGLGILAIAAAVVVGLVRRRRRSQAADLPA